MNYKELCKEVVELRREIMSIVAQKLKNYDDSSSIEFGLYVINELLKIEVSFWENEIGKEN